MAKKEQIADGRRVIRDYEVIDHGIDGSQYFQGCGTSFTSFEAVATGAGDSFNEALEDALEQLATEWNVEWPVKKDGRRRKIENAESKDEAENNAETVAGRIKHNCNCEACRWCNECSEKFEDCTCEDKNEEYSEIECDLECECNEGADLYYYVSIRVK